MCVGMRHKDRINDENLLTTFMSCAKLLNLADTNQAFSHKSELCHPYIEHARRVLC